jgi:2-polyprenyl-3-methyl-5-hydroxy-6-metoxy-1,4-benzoquinol methylase
MGQTKEGEPSAATQVAHWDEWNLERIREGLVRERRDLCDRVVESFKKLPLAHGAKVLDIGCGAGWTTERLYGTYDYLGLDLGEQSIAQARIRIPAARLEVANWLEYDPPADHYDGVLCIDTIAYFEDQDLGIEKMKATMKPGGWLVLSTVNPTIYSRMSWVGPPAPGQVRKWLTRHALLAMLERHGLQVMSSRTILPAGDKGLLRVLNARKVKRLLGSKFETLKESLGLGQFRVVIARRPAGDATDIAYARGSSIGRLE